LTPPVPWVIQPFFEETRLRWQSHGPPALIYGNEDVWESFLVFSFSDIAERSLSVATGLLFRRTCAIQSFVRFRLSSVLAELFFVFFSFSSTPP